MRCVIVPDEGNAKKLASCGFRYRPRQTWDGIVYVFIETPLLHEALMEHLGEGDFSFDTNLCF